MKNNLYIVASEISGNDLENGYVQSNAQNDVYYNLQSEAEKKDFIKNYAENLSDEEVARIYNYLEKEFDNSSDHFFALQSLIS